MKKCRNCKSSKLTNLFSLGNMSFTGKFPRSKKINIKKTKLSLVLCSNCSLVQLDRNYNLKYLYGTATCFLIHHLDAGKNKKSAFIAVVG